MENKKLFIYVYTYDRHSNYCKLFGIYSQVIDTIGNSNVSWELYDH